MYLIKKYRYVLLSLLIPYAFIIYIGCFRTNRSVTLTGGINSVDGLIEIDSNYKQEGSFNTIYVMDFDRSTRFQNFIVGNSKENEVSDNSWLSHLSNSEANLMNKMSHDQSISDSLICSYKKAQEVNNNIKLSYKTTCSKVYFRYKGMDVLRVGDEIIEVDGDSSEEVLEFIIKNRKIGSKYTIKRGNSTFEFEITKENYNKFILYPIHTIDFKETYPTIIINKSNVGGPSGGLLQTLSIFNSLTEKDYSHGLTIAGTGTIDIGGNVGAIGAITQKIYTAYKNKVDLFFCPEENYEEALTAYNKLNKKDRMKLVKVNTFADALEVLNNV